MSTLNTFNSHLDKPSYTGPYYFYLVDFQDIHNGKTYFRIIDAGVNMTHKERMAHFDHDINGNWAANGFDPQYEVTAYEIDMDGGEMLENGITSHVFHETYWDRAIQGAV
tara:strand:- start:22 stop:351 length:330 start_codon:yes stop_codon:yes gene_type:complete